MNKEEARPEYYYSRRRKVATHGGKLPCLGNSNQSALFFSDTSPHLANNASFPIHVPTSPSTLEHSGPHNFVDSP